MALNQRRLMPEVMDCSEDLMRSLSGKNRFIWKSDGFNVVIPIGTHVIHYPRASPKELRKHLLPKVRLTRRGGISPNQPPPPQRESYPFYLAQLIHYGLDFQVQIDEARLDLTNKLNRGSLLVPNRLKQIARNLREAHKESIRRFSTVSLQAVEETAPNRAVLGDEHEHEHSDRRASPRVVPRQIQGCKSSNNLDSRSISTMKRHRKADEVTSAGPTSATPVSATPPSITPTPATPASSMSTPAMSAHQEQCSVTLSAKDQRSGGLGEIRRFRESLSRSGDEGHDNLEAQAYSSVLSNPGSGHAGKDSKTSDDDGSATTGSKVDEINHSRKIQTGRATERNDRRTRSFQTPGLPVDQDQRRSSRMVSSRLLTKRPLHVGRLPRSKTQGSADTQPRTDSRPDPLRLISKGSILDSAKRPSWDMPPRLPTFAKRDMSKSVTFSPLMSDNPTKVPSAKTASISNLTKGSEDSMQEGASRSHPDKEGGVEPVRLIIKRSRESDTDAASDRKPKRKRKTDALQRKGLDGACDLSEVREVIRPLSALVSPGNQGTLLAVAAQGAGRQLRSGRQDSAKVGLGWQEPTNSTNDRRLSADFCHGPGSTAKSETTEMVDLASWGRQTGGRLRRSLVKAGGLH